MLRTAQTRRSGGHSTGTEPNERLVRLAAVPCPELSAAAMRVAERWRNDRGEAVEYSEVTDILEFIARAGHEGLPSEVSESFRRARSVLGRHLLDLTRAEVLRGWSGSHADSQPLVRVLAGLERVREALEPDWYEHFNSKLTGPGALELVVQVAHDLRSPLTSILFLAETLQKGQSGDVNDLQRRQLGLIYAAALGLSSVTSDVIELARGGDRLVDDEPSPFSINEIFESIRDIVRPIAEEKDLRVSLVHDASDHRLGHPLAVSRVLLNLTTNALKFTDEGYVEITAKALGLTRVEFAVRDTGPGINPEALDSLNQPFRRARGRDGYAVSGTGLGLAICRKLVEAMDSRLEFETDPSWGTRFSFVLDLPPATHI